MLNKENLKRTVLAELQKISDDGKLKSKIEIEEKVINNFAEICLSFTKEITGVYERYKKMEDSGKVDALEWIYISFLRTSLLDHSPCYRIDFYDSRGYISDIECAGSWDCDVVFSYYYNIMEEIAERLKIKTILKIYEANDIVNDLISYFLKISAQLITELIHSTNSDFAKMATSKNSIKVMLGDFLNDSEIVLEFKNDDPIGSI